MRQKKYQFGLESLISAVVLLIIIVDYSFFMLIPVENSILSMFMGSYRKFIPALIAVAVCCLVIYHCPYMLNTGSFVVKYLIAMVISLVFVWIYSYYTYDVESIKSIVLCEAHYMYVFLAIPVLWTFMYEGGYKKLMEKINVLHLIWFGLLFIQACLYLWNGTIFMQMCDNVQNGRLRIYMLAISNIMVIYNYDEIYNHRERCNWINFAVMILGFFELFFIQQTRGYYMAAVLGIIVITITSSNTIGKKSFLVIGIGGVFALLVYSGILNRFIGGLIPSESGGTTMVRVKAIFYYCNEFLKSPIFGHGIITSPMNANISKGLQGVFDYSDVGYFGTLAKYGIFSVILVIWPLIHFGKVCINVWKSEFRTKYALLFGLYGFLVFTSISLIVTDAGRALLYPFFFAIFEYTDLVVRKKIPDN